MLFSFGFPKGGETESPASHFLRNLLEHVLPICLGSPQTRPLFNSRAHRCCPLAQPLSFCCGHLPFCHAWQSGVPSRSFSAKLPADSTGALLGVGGATGSAGRAERPPAAVTIGTCAQCGTFQENLVHHSSQWVTPIGKLLGPLGPFLQIQCRDNG